MAGSQDPNDYSAVLFARGYVPLKRAVMGLERKWVADGRTAQAALLARAWADFEGELRLIGRRMAERVEREIKREEETTRVRGDTGGGGGPRLGDSIGESHSVDLVPGSVLINDERALEEGGVDWWWTNEEGYDGHIGREIRGVFMPGGVPPNQADFRAHPLFRPLGGATAPKGTIEQPIPERRFVKTAYDGVRADWHAEVQAAEQRFVKRLQAANLSYQQAVARGGRRGRGRRP